MRKLTPDIKELLDETTKYAPLGQLLKAAMWDVFYPKKLDILIDSLQRGKSWRFTFEDAQQKKSNG